MLSFNPLSGKLLRFTSKHFFEDHDNVHSVLLRIVTVIFRNGTLNLKARISVIEDLYSFFFMNLSLEKQYVSNTEQLDKIRQDWESTHISTCEVRHGVTSCISPLTVAVRWVMHTMAWCNLKCTDLDQEWQYPRPVLSMRMCNTSYAQTIEWVTNLPKYVAGHPSTELRQPFSCFFHARSNRGQCTHTHTNTITP